MVDTAAHAVAPDRISLRLPIQLKINMHVFSSADRALAARIEHAEASNAEDMARLASSSLPLAAFTKIGGGVAMFTGPGSPMTHAMGLGMDGPIPMEELERLETFYRERDSSCLIDLCPLADDSLISFVQNRPYRIVEFNNLLVRAINPDEILDCDPAIRSVGKNDKPSWSRIISEGFSEHMPVTDEQVQLMTTISQNSFCLLGSNLTGKAVGGAGLAITGRTALFLGDAILSSFRRQGWQARLIHERLRLAQQQGCDLAMASVLPGSASHRNYERAGFQLIYMRVNLARDFS